MEDIFPLSVGKIISGYRHWFKMVIELSGVQFGLKSYTWFQNRTHAARSFDLKSQVWFQTKIARHEVQLPLYYIPFEIDQIQDLVSSNILLMQHWAGLKLAPITANQITGTSSDFKMGEINYSMYKQTR